MSPNLCRSKNYNALPAFDNRTSLCTFHSAYIHWHKGNRLWHGFKHQPCCKTPHNKRHTFITQFTEINESVTREFSQEVK